MKTPGRPRAPITVKSPTVKSLLEIIDKGQLTYRLLAEAVGLGKNSIADLKRTSGEQVPIATVEKIADFYGYEVHIVRKKLPRGGNVLLRRAPSWVPPELAEDYLALGRKRYSVEERCRVLGIVRPPSSSNRQHRENADE